MEWIGGGRVPQTATHPLSVGTLLAEVQMLGGKSEDLKNLQSGESEAMNQTKLFIPGPKRPRLIGRAVWWQRVHQYMRLSDPAAACSVTDRQLPRRAVMPRYRRL